MLLYWLSKRRKRERKQNTGNDPFILTNVMLLLFWGLFFRAFGHRLFWWFSIINYVWWVYDYFSITLWWKRLKTCLINGSQITIYIQYWKIMMWGFREEFLRLAIWSTLLVLWFWQWSLYFIYSFMIMVEVQFVFIVARASVALVGDGYGPIAVSLMLME